MYSAVTVNNLITIKRVKMIAVTEMINIEIKFNDHPVYVYVYLIYTYTYIYFLCKTLGISGRAFSNIL